MLQKLSFLHHISSQTLNKFFAVLCVLLAFVYLIPRVLPHIHATGITVSNITFDPSTGSLDFDYSGDTLTGSQDLAIYNTGGSTVYWESDKKGHCTSSHCFGSVAPSTNSDSGVTAVIIQVGTVDQSQSLAYPLPLPATNAPQTPSAVGGWTATGDTWTYASASSFTISGVDRTSIFTPGTRIKATNNSTTFYGTVINSTFSTNTTVTLFPNGDYSLANSSITAPFYSYQLSPAGYPGEFSYTPTLTGFSSIDYAIAQFYVTGNMVTVQYEVQGTSNANNFIVSTPVVGNFNIVNGVITSARIRDNGNLQSNPAEVTYDATNMRLFKDYTETNNWTTSGTKSAYYTISYRF